MDKRFQIGEFSFRLVVQGEVPIPEHFLLFEGKKEMPYTYTYYINVVDQLEPPKGEVIANRGDLLVYKMPYGEGRLIGAKYSGRFYATYEEISPQEASIHLDQNELSDLNFDVVFTSLFALERRLYDYDSMVLHCAYSQVKDQAILFSAPSQVGKSTQAGLWETYKNAQTINGDRGLLKPMEDGWMVQGWPVCGSSEICHNEQMPIRAIVMLYQDKTNQVRRLKPIEAFRKIYGQITVNGWNANQGQKAIELTEQLVSQVPIFELGCTISKEAVLVLEQALDALD